MFPRKMIFEKKKNISKTTRSLSQNISSTKKYPVTKSCYAKHLHHKNDAIHSIKHFPSQNNSFSYKSCQKRCVETFCDRNRLTTVLVLLMKRFVERIVCDRKHCVGKMLCVVLKNYNLVTFREILVWFT